MATVTTQYISDYLITPTMYVQAVSADFSAIARKLGPERSQQALQAFKETTASWDTCALARAYGKKGELVRDCDDASYIRFAAGKLGITPQEALAVSEGHTFYACRAHEWVGADEKASGVRLKEALEAEAAKASPKKFAERYGKVMAAIVALIPFLASRG